MIYCFSGTGNSLWVAKELGRLLQEPVEGLAKYREMPLICRDDMVGFVLPRVVSETLDNAIKMTGAAMDSPN